VTQLLITGFLEIRWLDIIDILLVAVLLYLLYNLVKGTVAISILLGIVAIFIIWRIVDVLEMQLLRQILGAFISVGFIALIIIFQPEIRQFLLAVGKGSFINRRRGRFLWWKIGERSKSLDIDKIVKACQRMSNVKEGALIVVTRQNELQTIVDTGEYVDAEISVELIENIFFPNSPLHDGAIIITDNRIRAARCILPVTRNKKLPASLGLRHRAAIGVTENSDALAFIVSEQTGKISFAVDGEIKRNIAPAQLHDLLKVELGLVLEE
jgi:uncharacterized protein (TIGR00159 family)